MMQDTVGACNNMVLFDRKKGYVMFLFSVKKEQDEQAKHIEP